MILIFSQRNYEKTTDDIIRWLLFFGVSFKRINSEDFCETPNSFTIENEPLIEYKSIWFRRWLPNVYIDLNEENINNHDFFRLQQFLVTEFWSSSNLFFKKFNKSNWLSHPNTCNVNKIDVLGIAKNLGILIPETIITNDKEILRKFIIKYGNVITKPIVDGTSYIIDQDFYQMYTKIIDSNTIEILEEKFGYSLFQEEITKKFEIRSFFLDDQFYSMAIFSQNNTKTKEDFRNYDLKLPNRNVPIKLPLDTEKRLKKLMKKLNLNTGSIDLIYTLDNKFVFLEVNPVGQFGMVSFPCNYNLEKKIAEYLIEKS